MSQSTVELRGGAKLSVRVCWVSKLAHWLRSSGHQGCASLLSSGCVRESSPVGLIHPLSLCTLPNKSASGTTVASVGLGAWARLARWRKGQ